MAAANFLPHPLLRSCIQAHLYVDLDPGGNPVTFDLFPTGYSMLIFLLNEHAVFQDVHSRVIYSDRFHFVGQLTSHRKIKTTDAAEVCIVFKPAGAFRLFGLDQSCLVNDSIAVRDMLQNRVKDVLHRLEDAGQDIRKIIRILENWLLKLWRQNDRLATVRIEEATRKITDSSGIISIDELCSEIGMSKSSLEAHFKLKTGISPKMYNRITRFNHAYRQIKESNAVDWQKLVFRYNYYDQAHFIHEFKAFYGCTPTQIHSSSQNLAAIIKKQSEKGIPTRENGS